VVFERSTFWRASLAERQAEAAVDLDAVSPLVVAKGHKTWAGY